MVDNAYRNRPERPAMSIINGYFYGIKLDYKYMIIIMVINGVTICYYSTTGVTSPVL